MSTITYKAGGKGSRAWWLQAIKWFGQDSIKGIMVGVDEKYPQATRAAVTDLVSESYVKASGPTGRGLTPTYLLTELGEGYLSRNQDELEKSPEPATPEPAQSSKDFQAPVKNDVVYTWKRVLGDGVKYYADGQHIAAALVPETELARIREELGAGKFGSDVEHQQEAEYHEGDIYTWKQPIAGPCQYFLNGEFILQTKVPQDEMNRMLAEQGSPLLPTAEPQTYRVEMADAGVRHYFENDKEIQEADVPADKLEWMRTWTPPKEGDPRLKPTKRPPKLKVQYDGMDLADDELEDDNFDSDPDVPIKPSEPVKASARINKEPEPTPVENTPRINKGILEPNKESTTPPPTEPVNAAPAARKLFSQAEFVDLFREALVEVLLERYADQVTAGEVLQKLQERADHD